MQIAPGRHQAQRRPAFAAQPGDCAALPGAAGLLVEDYDRSQTDFLRNLALFDETGDDFNASRVLNDLGTLYQARGALGEAVFYYWQALVRLLSGWAGSSEEAMMRNNLGLALVSLGDDTPGAAELERARALYDRLSQPQGVARTQINLGQVYRRRGDLARASASYVEALQIFRRFGDQRPVVDVLNSLGLLARQQGRLDQASDYYLKAWEQPNRCKTWAARRRH
ncbi:MAG: tetratricopeptide repeat protein [Anaerolineae bacterium]|uniref:tetratricopeptide repeat protein n=1 Tax=Candidatus Amarolinea dominans TaxID=3140696 RepID=UPI0031373716|nr:tetratricopeptide repeat protein [Anaerolineae bacterium]